MFAPVDELFRLSQPPFSFASFQFFKFMFNLHNFSYADKCARYHDGRRAGVRNPAEHNWKATV